MALTVAAAGTLPGQPPPAAAVAVICNILSWLLRPAPEACSWESMNTIGKGPAQSPLLADPGRGWVKK